MNCPPSQAEAVMAFLLVLVAGYIVGVICEYNRTKD